MALKNPFSNKTRELFFFVYNCWSCGRNDNHELHHIMKRSSDSPYNAAILCHKCHENTGEVHSEANKRLFLVKTRIHLDTLGYEPTEKDLEFLKEHKKYYAGYSDLQ